MAESVRTGYKRLFEVRALHHYHLDDGGSDFTALDEAERQRRLLSGYDVRQFLSFAPTASTESMLRGLDYKFKATALGFVVAVPDDTGVSPNARFEFFATLQSADFMNYTALTLPKQQITEIQHDGKIYRYKKQVYVFSNSTGVKRTINSRDWLCLSKEIPSLSGAAPYPAEAFALDGNALVQAVRDTTAGMPASDRHTLAAQKDSRPAYVHQDDVPAIMPPVGAPLKGIELNRELPDDIFALIRIDAMPGDVDFQLLDTNFLPKNTCPVFEIHFKNRSTFWRYYNKTSGEFDDEPWPNEPLPLTAGGNPTPAGAQRKKASPASLAIKKDATGMSIEKLYSDIIE